MPAATIDNIVASLWQFVSTPSTWDTSAKVAVLTAISTVTWSSVRAVLKFLRFHLSSRLLTYDIELSTLADAIKADSKTAPLPYRLAGLLVRFGSDSYIKELASDQEKYEGRLQNTLLKMRRGTLLELPVHTRLGTQFKMFLDCDSEEDAKIFADIPFFKERGADVDGRKVWFLLKAFGTSKSVDGFTNNLVLPTRLDEFVERSSRRNLAATTAIKRFGNAVETHVRDFVRLWRSRKP